LFVRSREYVYRETFCDFELQDNYKDKERERESKEREG